MRQVSDTKFDANISNKIFLIAAIYQGYSFYRFWVIKGKLAGEGGITSPRPTQIRVKEWLYHILQRRNQDLSKQWK